MLKKNRQEHYFSKRNKSGLFHLRAFQKFGDTEELHRLRVEIKKMRALLMMDEKLFKKKKFQNHLKPVNKLFKQAGKIRTAQVNLELMNQYGIKNKKIDQQQTEILVEEAEKFYPKIDNYLKNFNKQTDFFSGKFPDYQDKKVKRLFTEHFKELEDFTGKLKPLQLHNFRKKLKRLLYFTSVFPSKRTSELNADYIRKLEEKIGKWHDTDVALTLVGDVKGGKKIITRLESIREKQNREIHSLKENFKKKANSENLRIFA